MKVSVLGVAFAFAAGAAADLCNPAPGLCGGPPTGVPLNCYTDPGACGLLEPGNGWWWIFGWRPPRPEGVNDEADSTASQPASDTQVTADAVQRRSLGVTNLPRQLIRAAIAAV